MIKSTIFKEAKDVKVKKYPYIGSYNFDGLVYVLFSKKDTGVVIMSEDGKHPIGYYTEAWGDDLFKPIAAGISITLTQQ